jgi:hypothetical protein
MVKNSNVYKIYAVLSLMAVTLIGKGEVMDNSDKLTVLRKDGTVYLRSAFSKDQDMVITVAEKWGTNFQTNFLNTRLVPHETPESETVSAKGLIIHNCGDDATPWNLNGTYIGGNHGTSDVIEITAKNHGLTVKDIGSAWTDESGKTFYMIKVPKADIIQLISENEGKDGIWKFTRSLKGKELKCVSDGKILNVETAKLTQLWPACRINKQEYLVNGKEPLAPNKSVVCDYFDIVEEYDIIAPDSLLESIKTNPGKEADFRAKDLDAVLTNRIVYRFQPMGACTVEHKSTARRKFNIGYMGFIQSAALTKGDFDTHSYYIPKTLPFAKAGVNYDFKSIQDFSVPPVVPLNFNSAEKNIEDKNKLPDRFIQFLGKKGKGGSSNRVGYAIGYSLIEGLTRPDERSVNCRNSLFLYTSSKTYPSAIDSAIGVVPAGKEFYCLAYRQYFDPSAYKNATSVYWHKEVDSYILYIDYHKPVENDIIKLPDYLSGKKISIVEKTPSVKLLNEKTVPTEGLSFSVHGAYGYAVLKLD